MRMGFHWKLAFKRKVIGFRLQTDLETGEEERVEVSPVCYPDCYKPVLNKNKEPITTELFINLKS